MNAHIFIKFLSIVLGYALVISSFLVFGQSLETDILILDIIVSCCLYTNFVMIYIFPMIDVGKKAHKEVGMMGIYYYTLNVCSVLSVGFMIVGIIMKISVGHQVIIQLFFLLILLVGMAATLHSGEKVERVYEKEQTALHRRDIMRDAMNDFMNDLALRQDLNLDVQIMQRLQSIQEDVRYISPSFEEKATDIEDKFCQALATLKVQMRDVVGNKGHIEREVILLEQIVKQRKSLVM